MTEDWASYRLVVFGSGLVIFTLLGWWIPRRSGAARPRMEQLHNLIMGGINPMALRLILSGGLIEWSMEVAGQGRGLLNSPQIPLWLSVGLFVMALDGIIYWQHRLTHKIPILWRLHRVHHTDTELDATTALRFHVLEIILSFFIKVGAIFVLGGGPLAVFTFEALLNFSAMFNHSNWAVSSRWDRVLRPVIVTPDFHRIHHSTYQPETDSNYGFFLSIWDYLFHSYCPEPRGGQLDMKVGLNSFRSSKEQSFWELLVQPFRRT